MPQSSGERSTSKERFGLERWRARQDLNPGSHEFGPGSRYWLDVDFLALLAHRASATGVVGATVEPVLELRASTGVLATFRRVLSFRRDGG